MNQTDRALAALQAHPDYGNLYSGNPAALRDLAAFVLAAATTEYEILWRPTNPPPHRHLTASEIGPADQDDSPAGWVDRYRAAHPEENR